MNQRILLIGPQGSGKGTQAAKLAVKLDIPSFAMGQLLRDEISADSDLGKKISDILRAGNLVSDEDAAEALKKRLAAPDTRQGFVLDGYPRNLEQYRVAETFLEPTHVVVIDVPREESLKRLSGRLTCQTCGKVYSVVDGFKDGDACECGGALKVREDDTPEAIARRLDIYEADTRPMIERYEASDLVRHVDGMGSVDEVHGRILNALDYGNDKDA